MDHRRAGLENGHVRTVDASSRMVTLFSVFYFTVFILSTSCFNNAGLEIGEVSTLFS